MTNLETMGLDSMTPMLQQYYKLKMTRPDAILFFRMGDFYEIFGDDASLVAPKLNIVLTSRERGDKNKIAFCGVPHHSARNYWMKLLAMNYKVAIADQVEDASQAKGLVKREIIKVLTPACIDELEGLDLESSNYLLAAYEDPKSKLWSALICDVSTGELRIGQLSSREEVYQLVENYSPKEILLRKFCQNSFQETFKNSEKYSSLLMGTLSESILNDKNSRDELYKEVFGQVSFEAQPCGQVQGGEELVTAVLLYLKELHFKLTHFRSLKALFDLDSKALEASVVRDLELLETLRSQKQKGSLYHAINETLTPMGARFLKHSLVNLVLKEEKILERQKKVEAFYNSGQEVVLSLRNSLSGLGDLERLNARIASSSIRPQELAKVTEGLKKVASVHMKLQVISKRYENDVFRAFEVSLGVYKNSLSLLEEALVEVPSQLGSDFQVFCKGYSSKLDELLEYVDRGQEKIDQYQNELREQTGITNLKIKPHKTYGLLIEISKSHLKKVPESFVRRQTMVNCDRFLTEELKDLDEVLSSARDQAVDLERELYSQLILKLQESYEVLLELASHLAQFDVVLSFAWTAIRDSYCKPSFTENKKLFLKKARHPVIEKLVGSSQFVANDIMMDEGSKILLITGPNMAGKSTIMRQTALCAVLAQMGSYLPCEEASLPVFDNLYTRVGASDDLSQGLSTFMVEMKEASHILRHATSKSLVILDEVGRGTSTEDGLALAHGILDFIAHHVKAWTLFATHYHELVEPARKLASVKLVHTKVLQKADCVHFTHELIEGSSGNSYGLEVAKLAGIPKEVLLFAQKLINKKEKEPLAVKENKIQSAPLTLPLKSPNADIRDLRSQEILSRLERININRTTPVQALNILNDLVVICQTNPTKSLFHDGQTFF